MMTRASIAVLFLMLQGANGKGFLGAKPEIDPAYIQLVIQGALEGVLGSGHGYEKARLAAINATLFPMFKSLPKNAAGRLNAPIMRYAVHRYFSQRFGWTIRGFESQAMTQLNNSDMQTAHIMQNKVPSYVENVLKKTLSSNGFALPDMVIAVASIEVLIFDETLTALEKVYRLNKKSTTDLVKTNKELANILTSYFIVEHLEGESENITQHVADRSQIGHYYPHWPDTWRFISDIVGDDYIQRAQYSNPFKREPLSFESVSRITRTISEKVGIFSNHECHEMKMKLAEMDVHGTGRVRLADFYRSSKEKGTWQFLETAEYLQHVGALDTSSQWLGPQVIIPNYLTGMNNCISSSVYYDVCCLNECDAIFQHLEAHIQAPMASAAEITRAIEEGITMHPLLSSTAPTEPRNLTQSLRDMLAQTAEFHDGMIPLHGRLFAQWLHFAFPHECPYPHFAGTVSQVRMEDTDATLEEMTKHIESEVGRRPLSPDAGKTMWIVHEELLEPKHGGARFSIRFSHIVHFVVIASIASVLLRELHRIVRIGCGKGERKETSGTEVSYYI